MTISRDEARTIALAHLRREWGASSTPIGESTHRRPNLEIGAVLLLEEIDSRPPTIYGLYERLKDCWIAYVDLPFPAIRASEVVIISRDSGEVVYAGSAYDEG